MNAERFTQLARHEDTACLTVTLSLPADTPSARSTHINSIVSESERELVAGGVDPVIAKAWVTDLRRVLTSPEMDSAHGVVYLRSANEAEVVYTHEACDRMVFVGGSFVLTSLASSVVEEPHVTVFAVSRGGWRLLTRTDGRVTRIEIPDMPTNLEDANSAFEQPIEGGAQHANVTGGTRGGSPRAHRQGFGHERPDDTRDLRYAEALARGLATLDDSITVVGLAPLTSTLRDKTRARIDEVLFTDPQTLTDEELYQHVVTRLQEDDAVDETFGASKGDGLFVDNPHELLKQARNGNIRVAKIPSEPSWIRDRSIGGQVDVVTQVAAEVLAHGGRIVTGEHLAGVQRWPLHPVA